MTDEILLFIKCADDLLYLSAAYRKGDIKLNISKLARELNVDRKTVRSKLNGITKKARRPKKKYLDDYRELILQLLNDDTRKFEYKQHLYNYMVREHNITCSRTTFIRYIQSSTTLNETFKTNQSQKFTERFETKPGQQAQFDLKERIALVLDTGEVVRVNVATLTLGFSRYNIRKIVLDTQTETIIQFLAEAFEILGGVVDELVIDNIKCLVTKPRTKGNNDAIFNSTFEQFLHDYRITCLPCVPYRPQTKGKTETQNKKPGQLQNYNGTFKDMMDVHNLMERLNIEDNQGISQATKLPREFLLQQEKDDFSTLPAKSIREKYHLSIKQIAVSNESMIIYKGNKYSVPKRFIGTKLDMEVRGKQLHIYYSSKIIVVHNISNKLLNIHKQHDLTYKNIKELHDEGIGVILEEMRNIVYD